MFLCNIIKLCLYNINWTCHNSLSPKICCIGITLVFSLQQSIHRIFHFWAPNVWGFFLHIHQFSNASRVSYDYLEIVSDPTGCEGSVPQDCPPFQMLIAGPRCYLWFWLTAYQSEVPSTPFMGSRICYSGSWNSGIQFTYYIPVDYKSIQLSKSQIEEMRGAGRVGMGSELPCPLQVRNPQPCTSIYSSNPEGLQLGFFMEAPLHRHDGLNHWTLVTELHLQPL